jgi:3-hydroxybutyryl-CoA dehydrogenase
VTDVVHFDIFLLYCTHALLFSWFIHLLLWGYTFNTVIGMHFMNPVPLMQLVECIKGLATSEDTYQTTIELAHELGKQTCTSADRPGFIVNRVLMPMINEAFYALMEGVGSAEDIDIGMKLGTNQPMGPLRLADYIGLDTCLAILRVLHRHLGDDKYRACPLLAQHVDAGWLGKKTGRGIYAYSEGTD